MYSSKEHCYTEKTKHCRDAIIVKLCCQDTPYGLAVVLDADLNLVVNTCTCIHVHWKVGWGRDGKYRVTCDLG
jgi:hypothetical protein